MGAANHDLADAGTLRPTAVAGRVIGRLAGFAAGAVLFVALLPVMAVVALGVAVELRTWRAFFVQRRLGLRGRPFAFVKLRTLPVSAPAYALKTEVVPAPPGRLVDFLRRSHLDELPQLALVLTGRLSLVGPRPKMPHEVEPVEPLYGAVRTSVPQGCTGLWQVSVAANGLPDASPEYDLFYVAHRGIRLDGWILWRTALLMSGLAGPISLGDVPRWAHRRRPHLDLAALRAYGRVLTPAAAASPERPPARIGEAVVGSVSPALR